MCNCNQQRSGFSAANDANKRGMVRVTLVEDTPLTITGNVTGRMYVFRNIHDFNWVDKRDAPDLRDIKALIVVYS
jgi:hypothetical protein